MATWTEQAAKKARKAELERYLLRRFYDLWNGYFGEFVDWLKQEAAADTYMSDKSEAEELIDLYNEGM